MLALQIVNILYSLHRLFCQYLSQHKLWALTFATVTLLLISDTSMAHGLILISCALIFSICYCLFSEVQDLSARTPRHQEYLDWSSDESNWPHQEELPPPTPWDNDEEVGSLQAEAWDNEYGERAAEQQYLVQQDLDHLYYDSDYPIVDVHSSSHDGSLSEDWDSEGW